MNPDNIAKQKDRRYGRFNVLDIFGTTSTMGVILLALSTFSLPICAQSYETLTIASVNKQAKTMTIQLDNTIPVSYCAISISGANIISASGGKIQAEGFSYSISNNRLTAIPIQQNAMLSAGSDILTTIEYVPTGTEACIVNPDIRDQAGAAIGYLVGACQDIDTVRPGCTDPGALNYNPLATFDDGSCIYSQQNPSDPIGVSINKDNAPAHSSAILDLTATDQGFLTTRVTATQRTSINSPGEGLFLYDLTARSFYYYSINQWKKISAIPAGSLGQTLRNDGNNWIGTNNLFNDGTNIGIGTINPTEKLHVNGTTMSNVFKLGDSGGNGINWDLKETTDNDFSLSYGTYGEYFRIDYSTGNVGIGTSSPSSTLHVKSLLGYGQLRLETPYTPTSGSDSNGQIGDFAWDDDYLYLKTSNGWKRLHWTNLPNGNGGGNGGGNGP